MSEVSLFTLFVYLFTHTKEETWLWLFSHDGKVRILNCDSRCASWITIQNTLFWTVCTPNHVEIRDLRCVTRKPLLTVIWDAHLKSRISACFGVHTVQNAVFRIVIQDAHLESRFKIRTLPSCENSLCLVQLHVIWMGDLATGLQAEYRFLLLFSFVFLHKTINMHMWTRAN